MKRAAMISGLLVLLGVTFLGIDYAIARVRGAADTKLVESLQEKVREDAKIAPRLEAEQKRIAAGVLARKNRVEWISWALLAAFAAFVASASRLVQPAPAPEMPERLVQIAGARPGGSGRTKAAAPEEIDLTAVDEIVRREGTSEEAVIPILQAIQAHYRYLPDAAMTRVSELTGIAPSLLAGTSSFYSRFRSKPVGAHIVRVCHGTACHVAGARQITDEIRRELGLKDGEDTDASRTFTVEEVACLGCCSLAPVLMVDEHTAGRLTPATACSALEAAQEKETA